jgi:chromosome partitioning protein
MRSIGFISEKGGVGKSTSAINVAAGLAGQGRGVLVVDTDPQGNASHVLLRGEKPRRPTLLEVIAGDADAAEAIVSTHFDGVDVLPADASLADAAMILANEVGRERRLRVAMEAVAGRYDFVLIDTAPTRSILTTNVLNFAGEVLVPFTPGLFGVLGLGQLQGDVEQVRRFLENKALRIAGVFLTQADKNNVHRDLEAQLRGVFGDLVFTARIPRSIKIEEAHARHESVITYAPKSVGAAAYQALVREVIARGQRQEDRHAAPRGNPPADDAAA